MFMADRCGSTSMMLGRGGGWLAKRSMDSNDGSGGRLVVLWDSGSIGKVACGAKGVLGGDFRGVDGGATLICHFEDQIGLRCTRFEDVDSDGNVEFYGGEEDEKELVEMGEVGEGPFGEREDEDFFEDEMRIMKRNEKFGREDLNMSVARVDRDMDAKKEETRRIS
ncbi:hypothetical protein Tco_0138964 [Tanacetum coccineum]